VKRAIQTKPICIYCRGELSSQHLRRLGEQQFAHTTCDDLAKAGNLADLPETIVEVGGMRCELVRGVTLYRRLEVPPSYRVFMATPDGGPDVVIRPERTYLVPEGADLYDLPLGTVGSDLLKEGPPRDRLIIICCGCGAVTDLPKVSRLIDTQPSCFTYRATCEACGFTHTIRVTRS
jgi:hypothetical protein